MEGGGGVVSKSVVERDVNPDGGVVPRKVVWLHVSTAHGGDVGCAP